MNFDGEKLVLEAAVQVIQTLDKKPKLTFQETKSKEGDAPSFKVTLGIMPDYTWEGEGVHVDGVTDGKPASKAGILKGDIIKILDEQGKLIGLGIAKYGADKARERIGLKNQKPLVHYDYFYAV